MMRLYCARAGIKDRKKNVSFALPFKYLEAWDFLSQQTFGGRTAAEEKKRGIVPWDEKNHVQEAR